MLLNDNTPCGRYGPSMWSKDDEVLNATAIRLCRECPLARRCLDEVLETEKLLGETMKGIHGAKTERQRRRYLERRKAGL